MSELERGKEVFRRDCDPKIVAKTDELVAMGRAVWILDPVVEGVVALVRDDDRQRAYVLVYLEGGGVRGFPKQRHDDFEISVELEEMMAG